MKVGAVPYEEVAVELYRDDPQLAVNMLNVLLEEGDTQGLLVALRQISKAYGGIPEVAKSSGMHEKTLYKTLSPQGNPTLETLVSVAGAMGMRLAFVPAATRPS